VDWSSQHAVFYIPPEEEVQWSDVWRTLQCELFQHVLGRTFIFISLFSIIIFNNFTLPDTSTIMITCYYPERLGLLSANITGMK
ncbi:hypothetical protein L9F63_015746, partial [Diploptera punctata]